MEPKSTDSQSRLFLSCHIFSPQMHTQYLESNIFMQIFLLKAALWTWSYEVMEKKLVVKQLFYFSLFNTKSWKIVNDRTNITYEWGMFPICQTSGWSEQICHTPVNGVCSQI